MMTSLLSIFDPCSSTMLYNWIIILMLLIMPFSSSFWKVNSKIQHFYFYLLNLVCSLFNNNNKINLFLVSTFFFFLYTNFIGLIPFGFSLSSHFSFNFFFASSLWVATMMWGFSKNLEHNIAHLTPLGCPTVLVPFMVLVESISSVIRPLTLSLRLMSNMLAGHMILCLLGKAAFLLSGKILFWMLELGFFMFELGVAIIQTYVYSSLMYLYWVESE